MPSARHWTEKAQEVVTVESASSVDGTDEAALRACGYEQEFKRELSLFSSFSVSFSVLGILPSVAATLTFSLGYSGTAGLTW
ncbi:hypothetical protein AURDEDRAFT_156730 [Auricularia subglabra TFB-10046 SS5]|nr:hypothetical protein AURDEDRAFT_156730 [Auricularia subglabra TFB-10046 SS5]